MYESSGIALLKASLETIYMVFIASFVSIVIGLVLGCILFILKQEKTMINTLTYRSLGLCVNSIRSLPFIILLILIMPFTRLITGTSIGTNAAIIPLTIAAIPFFARICENALAEVPHGLIEAAHAMGASTWHMVTKILLPESLSALIRGATLTIIGLIGYSAMAGVIGGGGLGELAINYGYQRFDVLVMFETVCILLILVQAIQVFGDYLAKQNRIKYICIASVVVASLCVSYSFWPAFYQHENSLKIGIIGGWSEEVMKEAAQVAQQQYGLQLEIVRFTDYVQPNEALNHHAIDANIFQHLPYLQAQTDAHHYRLIPIAKTFVYPMGFYSKKIINIAHLKHQAIVAIPNDPSNCSRALLLLQKFKLITLKPGAGTLATVHDIVENPYDLQFKLLDAAQLPRSLTDADLVAITNDFLHPAKLTIQDAILKEGSDSSYANLIVIREEDKEKPIFQKLIAAMHSNPVTQKTEQIFPEGAAIPAW